MGGRLRQVPSPHHPVPSVRSGAASSGKPAAAFPVAWASHPPQAPVSAAAVQHAQMGTEGKGDICSQSVPGCQASVPSSVRWANVPFFPGSEWRDREQQSGGCGLRSQAAM